MTPGHEGDTSAGGARTSRGGSGEGDTPAGLSSRRHGTDSDYKNGCRCDECKAAHTAYSRKYRAVLLTRTDVPHGTTNTFDAGCRCEPCREAHRISGRKTAQKKHGTETVRCHVCGDRVGTYRDGSLCRHGVPKCDGSLTLPPRPTVLIVGHWRDYAACLGDETNKFYPATTRSAAPARRICASCPVAVECLNDALISDDKWGVRGGFTGEERRRMKRERVA